VLVAYCLYNGILNLAWSAIGMMIRIVNS
jgi:hypothetical protein